MQNIFWGVLILAFVFDVFRRISFENDDRKNRKQEILPKDEASELGKFFK
jgi:hypothetical protein